MRRPDATLARIRPLARPVLLGVFLLAAQGTPLVHLATHHDHTHGPEAAADDDHGDSEDDGHVHEHDDRHASAHLDHHDEGTPAAPPPSHDHGRVSSAHFGLALLEGPPTPFLPPPAATLARPPDIVPRRHHAPAKPHPPVRGPPRLS